MEYFIHPERLWNLVWVLPFISILYIYVQAKRKRAYHALLGTPHRIGKQILGLNLSPSKRFLKFLILLCACMFLVITYATPTWGKKVIPISGAGRDIMVALDLSKSMLAKDLPPNRLAQAKLLVSELTQKMRGDRFGLVAFAGRPMMVCPLTFDRVSFMQILQSQDMNTIPLGGTDLQQALALSAKHLEGTTAGHRAILLITDGGELTGSLLTEAEKLKAQQMPVVVVGVGDPIVGSPIQIPDGKGGMRFVEDANRQVVNSKLLDAPLRRLAQETGGVYIHSTLTDLGVGSAMHYLQQLTPTAHDESSKTLPIERTTYFLVLSLICLLAWFLIGETQKVESLKDGFIHLLRSKIGLIIIGLSVTSWSHAQSTAEDVKVENIYNEGVKLHHDAHVDSAQERYEMALVKSQNKEKIKTASSHNLGTIYHQKAREIFQNAIQKAKEQPSASLKILDEAEALLKQGEEFYKEALTENEPNTVKNQRHLLQDRKQIAQLKKLIKQLEEQMKKSAEQTQKAQEQQQKSNQQKQDAQQEQNQQKKNDKQQQQEQSQQQANEKTQSAKESAEDMQKAAEKLDNQQMKDKAQAIKDQLEKAQEAQEKKDGKKAEEHLKNAAQQLNNATENAQKEKDQAEQEAQEKAKKDEESKDSDQKEGQSQGQEDLSKKDDAQKSQVTEGDAKDAKELTESAAASILREMAKEEAEAREKILKKNQGKEPAPLNDY